MRKLFILATLVLFLLTSGHDAASMTSPGVFHGPQVPARESASINWSGYVLSKQLSTSDDYDISSVSGEWVIPAISCAADETSFSAIWVGIDGFRDNTVEQIGTGQDCVDGAPDYYAWYELYPRTVRRINMRLAPGDRVAAEVRYVRGDMFNLTLRNMTGDRAILFARTERSQATRHSAEWIVEAPSLGRVLPLANFGEVKFNNAVATLVAPDGYEQVWQYEAITMFNRGIPKTAITPLSSEGSFSVAWERS